MNEYQHQEDEEGEEVSVEEDEISGAALSGQLTDYCGGQAEERVAEELAAGSAGGDQGGGALEVWSLWGAAPCCDPPGGKMGSSKQK